MKVSPLLIGNLILVKEKAVKGIYVRAVNAPGVLAQIASVLGKHNVNILAINFSSNSEEKGDLFIVADFSKISDDLNVIIDDIQNLGIVLNAEIVEPHPLGLLVDLYHFPIVDDIGNRVLIFTIFNMESFAVRLREKFGDGGLAFLFHEGVLTGLSLVSGYKRWGIGNLKDALIINLLRVHALGRYRGELVKYSLTEQGKPEIVIKAYDMWECETARKHGIRKPSCHFERGVMTGIIKGYLGKDVVVRETKCIAVGDPYCEFITE